jgi:hypothetical protein
VSIGTAASTDVLTVCATTNSIRQVKRNRDLNEQQEPIWNFRAAERLHRLLGDSEMIAFERILSLTETVIATAILLAGMRGYATST